MARARDDAALVLPHGGARHDGLSRDGVDDAGARQVPLKGAPSATAARVGRRADSCYGRRSAALGHSPRGMAELEHSHKARRARA